MKVQTIVKNLVTSLSTKSFERTTRPTTPNFLSRSSVLAVAALALASTTHAQSTLPVYRVVKSGATAAQAAVLAKQLGIPSSNVLKAGGAIAFVNTSSYLSLPTASASSPLLEEAIAATKNKDSSRKITPTVLNANAISSLPIISAEVAIAKTAAALKAAGLTPAGGEAFNGNHELSLFSDSSTQGPILSKAAIDTEVCYHFTAPIGIPIVGPGAAVQVTYAPGGKVSRVFYAARTLTPAGIVDVISQSQINTEIASMYPGNSTVSSRLVYYAPPLSTAADVLIPYYAYTVTTPVMNVVGAVSEMRSKIGFLPATTDTRFVPRALLSAEGGTTVHASVSVVGGRPPYRYSWGTSNPSESRTNSSTLSYTPLVRTASSLNIPLQHDESLSVTIVDANGVSVSANAMVGVEATPLFPQTRDLALPLFGSENPGDPLHWMGAENAWNTEMAKGVTESFDWPGDLAWPGDFIRPTPSGTLVAEPWINGDADFSNWGVDNADIVLDNADGWSDGFTAMYPGAAATDYNTGNGATLSASVLSPDVQIANQNYTVNYNGSWGPVGPNDTLEWLLLDDCDVLDSLDGFNLNVAQRWGPAFGGVHVVTGFASLDYDSNGAFEGGVADDVLGIGGPAQTIVQSWFNSASAQSTGDAAAMGPAEEVAPGIYACDSGDSFWGKGPVGPTLNPASIPPALYAIWYVSDTTPMEYLF